MMGIYFDKENVQFFFIETKFAGSGSVSFFMSFRPCLRQARRRGGQAGESPGSLWDRNPGFLVIRILDARLGGHDILAFVCRRQIDPKQN